MSNKRRKKRNPAILFGWLGLFVAIGFFWFRADQTSGQMLELFSRSQQQIGNSASAVFAQSQLMKAAIREQIQQDSSARLTIWADSLDRIDQKTATLRTDLHRHLAVMDSIAQWDADQASYSRPGEEGINQNYWTKNQVTFEQRLEQHAYWLGDQFLSYEVVGPEFLTNWEELPLSGPVIGNIALLKGLDLEILQAERMLLEVINQRFGVAEYASNKWIPLAIPEKQSVLAGQRFRARVGVTNLIQDLHPRFSSPSGLVEMDALTQEPTLSIPARSGSIPPGQEMGIQFYSLQIAVKDGTGASQNFQLDGQFEVRKPKVQLTSSAGISLYQNCNNQLSIDIPELGMEYNPIIEASQASWRVDPSDSRTFYVEPKGKNTDLRVSNQVQGETQFLTSYSFRVVEPPRPRIQLWHNGDPVDELVGIDEISEVGISLVPDPDFATLHPEDARYGSKAVEIWTFPRRGLPRLLDTQALGDQQDTPWLLDLTTPAKRDSLASGTLIQLHLTDIYRINYEGQPFPDLRFQQQERRVDLWWVK